jgi:hypothetical protein
MANPSSSRPTPSARTTAGIAGKNGANVAPISKPTTPAAHVISPVPGGNKSNAAKAAAAESMFAKDVASGKVKNLDAERQMVAKKTGAWPNGATN